MSLPAIRSSRLGSARLVGIAKRPRETQPKTDHDWRVWWKLRDMQEAPETDTRLAKLPKGVRARLCVAYYEAEDAAMNAAEPHADWPNTAKNERKNKAFCARWNRWRRRQMEMERRTMEVGRAFFGDKLS